MSADALMRDAPAAGLSIRQTAARLGVSEPTVGRMIRAGSLRSTKIGARRVIAESAVSRLLDQGVAVVGAAAPVPAAARRPAP